MSHLSFKDYLILFNKGTVHRNKLHFSKQQDHFLASHSLETTTHTLINLGQTCDEHKVIHQFSVKWFCNCSISNQKCIQKLNRVGELCVSCQRQDRNCQSPNVQLTYKWHPLALPEHQVLTGGGLCQTAVNDRSFTCDTGGSLTHRQLDIRYLLIKILAIIVFVAVFPTFAAGKTIAEALEGTVTFMTKRIKTRWNLLRPNKPQIPCLFRDSKQCDCENLMMVGSKIKHLKRSKVLKSGW